MGLIKTLTDRWNAELPIFFKKVRAISLTLGGPAMAIWAANQTMSLQLPELVLTVCKYIIAICAGMGLTAQLTKTDAPTNS